MKTIKITDEMYNSLISISNELNTQYHRCTRMPYMIQVSKKVEVAAYEGCGKSIWVNEDGDTLRTCGEIDDYLSSIEDEDYFEHFLYLDDYEDYLIGCNECWRMVQVTTTNELSDFFFTEKGLRDFYGKEVNTFLTASSNPELKIVMKFLCELSGGKLHL